MLEIKNLNIYLDNKKIVDDFNLKLNINEKIGIIGKSGSGKTQISKVIMKNCKLKYDGKILIDNNEKYTIGKDVAMISQDFSQSLNPVLKVKTQMIEALIYHKILNKKEALIKAKRILKNLNLNETYLEKYPFELSGGEKQRIVIGIILMLEPRILICDEISSGLDPLNEFEIMSFINKMNISIIYITHSVDIIKNVLKDIYYLNKTKCEKFNSFDKLIKIENDEYIKALKKVCDIDVRN